MDVVLPKPWTKPYVPPIHPNFHIFHNVQSLRSGSLQIDIATGTDGYLQGHLVEIAGDDQSCKTTLSLHAIANAQRQGRTVLYVDTEMAFPVDYARKIGVTDTLWIMRPSSGEEAFLTVTKLLRQRRVDVVVMDSITALCPKHIRLRNLETSQDLFSDLTRHGLFNLKAAIKETGAIAIITQQLRSLTTREAHTGFSCQALHQCADISITLGKVFPLPPQPTAQPSMPLCLQSESNCCHTMTEHMEVHGKPVESKAFFEVTSHMGIDPYKDIMNLGIVAGCICKNETGYFFESCHLGNTLQEVYANCTSRPHLLTAILHESYARRKEFHLRKNGRTCRHSC